MAGAAAPLTPRLDWHLSGTSPYHLSPLLTPTDLACRHTQVGANQSNLVTKTSSLGMWVPVHDEEWDGDIPLSLNRPNRPDNDSEDGEVVFQRGTLPWQTGRYEVRPQCISSSLRV